MMVSLDTQPERSVLAETGSMASNARRRPEAVVLDNIVGGVLCGDIARYRRDVDLVVHKLAAREEQRMSQLG